MIGLGSFRLLSTVGFVGAFGSDPSEFALSAVTGAMLLHMFQPFNQPENARAVRRTPRHATSITWTRCQRLLICVIGGLVITIGLFAIITTAPAGRAELSSFGGPVG